MADELGPRVDDRLRGRRLERHDLGKTALLVERAGAKVAATEVVLELAFLEGRKRLADRPVNAILTL